MKKFVFKLFVTGQGGKSRTAVLNLRNICEQEMEPDLYEITVIDVLEQPDVAEQAKVLATPTIVRELPPPVRRVIGDLSRSESVRVALELRN